MRKKRAICLLILFLSFVPIVTQSRVERMSGDIRIFLPEAGYLGLEIGDVSQEDVSKLGLPLETGVYLESVQPQTPASRA